MEGLGEPRISRMGADGLGVQGGWWCGGEWESREAAISGADSAIGWEVWLGVRCWCLV
jgi:hypothetical protein